MIIDEIVLNNLGVYRGRQRINLTPKSAKRRVVLIGALNGSGKTTLLDAMQLALYGRLGEYTSRRESSYEEFLRQLINKHAPAHEGASIDLHFRHAREGIEHQYHLHRAWNVSDGKIRERFDVICDGRHDTVLVEHWNEYIEELLPSRIAPLFFFDGEKIEQLADAQKAPELLKVAIQSLLGIDIVQWLQTDLGVLQRRKGAELAPEADRIAIAAVEKDMAEIENDVQKIADKGGSLKNELDRTTKKLSEAEASYRKAGGTSFAQRMELKVKHEKALGVRETVLKDLRSIAAGSLPFAIVSGRLEKLNDDDNKAAKSARSKALNELVAKRDKLVIDILRKNEIASKAIIKVGEALAADREKLTEATKDSNREPLSDDARSVLTNLLNGLLQESKSEAKEKVKALEDALSGLADLDRQLANVPDEDKILRLTKLVMESEQQLASILDRIKHNDDEKEVKDQARESVRRKLGNLLEKEVESQHRASDAARIIDHAGRAGKTLAIFEQAVVKHHLVRLEKLVVTALNSLFRKERLIAKVQIDPEDFSLVLRDNDDRIILPQMLSAGERQLLAVSLLWSLAQASGRPIPTVVDTPLGRLDSHHRVNLVEKYFPTASHQVILLSTDEEIDATYYNMLEPSISHSYTLAFDAEHGGTKVVEGFAFAEG